MAARMQRAFAGVHCITATESVFRLCTDGVELDANHTALRIVCSRSHLIRSCESFRWWHAFNFIWCYDSHSENVLRFHSLYLQWWWLLVEQQTEILRKKTAISLRCRAFWFRKKGKYSAFFFILLSSDYFYSIWSVLCLFQSIQPTKCEGKKPHLNWLMFQRFLYSTQRMCLNGAAS